MSCVHSYLILDLCSGYEIHSIMIIVVWMVNDPCYIHLILPKSSGGTALVQEESSGVHSAGYVQMDKKMICGETWDLAASQVVCRELGWGPPVEVAGYAKEFLLGPLPGSPCHVLKILHGRGW